MPTRLRELREDQNTSQEDIAAAAGVSQGTWSTWEKETPKQFAALEQLARRYKISANYLLGLTDDPVLAVHDDPEGGQTIAALHSVVLELSERRRRDLLALARALHELDQQEAPAEVQEEPDPYLEMYDLMMGILEKAGGEETVEALEAALRARDTAQALLLIDAFFAGRDARTATEEPLEEERKKA